MSERPTPDLTLLRPILGRYAPEGRLQLIPTLLEAQEVYGFLPERVVEAIGEGLKVPLAEIRGVIEFYPMLPPRPTGRTIVRVCTSPICAQAGGEAALEAACHQLRLKPDEVSADGKWQIERAPCLGLCDHAPAALVGETPVAKISEASGAGRWFRRPSPAPLGIVGGGRGGAASPPGAKWEMTAAAQADERFVVANADDPEPGTFKDRILMEGDPFFVLEGILLAGYAVGARRGYLYVRGEYPRAQRILGEAISIARKAGFLGEKILGTPFSFDIELRWGTVAPAAWIIAHGAEAYREQGTSESPGTKLFCLSGDVARPGVYEVPFGSRLRDLLTLAGGVRGELQAVLLGGAAGAFATPDQLDLHMSFEGLRQAGLPLGSGVVMAINRTRHLRPTLLSLAHFFAHESCGKCFPCQLGPQRPLEILEKTA